MSVSPWPSPILPVRMTRLHASLARFLTIVRCAARCDGGDCSRPVGLSCSGSCLAILLAAVYVQWGDASAFMARVAWLLALSSLFLLSP